MCVDYCTVLNFVCLCKTYVKIDLSRACQNDIFLSFCSQDQALLKSYKKNYVVDIFKVLHLF